MRIIFHSNDVSRLDDGQDGSQLRRGSPATHIMFGEAQTTNSNTLQYVQATAKLRKLVNMHYINIFVEEVRNLFAGQRLNLYWTAEVQCPSVLEYMQMIDGSTSNKLCSAVSS
jgi:geranylgeranyl diphosphate synthase type 3